MANDDTLTCKAAGDPQFSPSTSAPSSHEGWMLVFGAREFRLDAPMKIVGRSIDADIVIDSQGISRRHARVTVSCGHVYLEDLGSKNGTFVNGVRLDKPLEILEGEHVRLGPIWLTLQPLPEES